MKLEKNTLRRWAAGLVLAVLVSQISVPAMAVSSNIVSETKDKTELTVSQIKDLAVIYNPTNKTYALNQKNLDLNQTTTANSLRSAQNSLNSGYDVDTSSVTTIQAQIDALLSKYDSEEEMTASDKSELTLLRQQLSQAEAGVNSAYAANESSFQNALSNIEQLDSTLDSYDDEQDDLDKTVSDWETQVRMIAEVLCMQVTQYDKNIALLEDQITLAEKAFNLAQVQQQLGMALTTDVQSSQTSLEESRQSLETVKENLSDVKRQINVLIGRNQGSPLEIVPMSVPVIVSEIPAYSDGLVKEITSKDYTLKTYERTIANNVKSQLAKMTTDKASYETSQTKVTTEKKNLEVAQKKYDLGMLTASQLLQQEISYQSAVVTHWKNSYNYYLDWQEYKAMKEGIDTSTYSTYRI